MSKQDRFIEQIAPYAQEVQRKYGVPASIVIAQAALETGWSDKVLGNNLFGIKAGKAWQGAVVETPTSEFINGAWVKITDSFRSFGSVAESFDGYGQFLTSNTRYAGVLKAGSAEVAANELQRSGYATDPKYADKLKSIIATNNLTRFDDVSYSGYLEGQRFQQTRDHLKQQRDSNPGIWDGFMKIFEFLAEIVSGLTSLIFGGDTKTASAPLPTPTGSQVAAVATTVPPRGA